MTPGKLPVDARIFSFPQRSRRSLTTALVIMAGLMSFCVYSALFTDGRPHILFLSASSVFFGWLAALQFRRLRAVDDRIAISESGMWRLPARGEFEFIAWNDIRSVRSHGVMRYLEVDGSGPGKITLEWALENFGELRQLIVQHRAETK